MKAKIRAKAETIFRNQDAIDYYNRLASDLYVYEYGIDTEGKIYFAWLNGNVDRYSRREFLRIARSENE
jgi:hypothetical protein